MAAGELDKAEGAASRFSDGFDRAHGKIKIAKAHLAAGRREEANRLVREVAERYRTNVDMPNVMSVRENLWPLYLKLDEVVEALQFARTIPVGNSQRCRALVYRGAQGRERAIPRQRQRSSPKPFKPRRRSKTDRVRNVK